MNTNEVTKMAETICKEEENFRELAQEGEEAYKRVFTLSIEIDRHKKDYERLRNIVSELKKQKKICSLMMK